ncbi:MAG: 8-amino-7-oxononanoate synthase [Muribaculaceae bacterium]|nr:8-amino-7-oxononanoate synthase [Muribaculaceae bacterium]
MSKTESSSAPAVVDSPTPTKAYSDILSHLRDENRLREIPADPDANFSTVDLLSNDYLGLGSESHLYIEEFRRRFPDAEFTSSASRLLSRRNHYHSRLEAYLEELYGRPALLFNSGYHANVGMIQALAIPSTLFLADKLVHASAIDGLRLSGADYRRFPHNDIKKLKRLLRDNHAAYERIIVVVESVYSMDGDLTPIERIVALKKDFPNMMIYLDEAHGFGVRGERGLGLAEEKKVVDDIDIIMGTLGKAAASAGAFAVASPAIKDYLVNTARSFIFSTAISPAQAAWSILMIEKLTAMSDRRRRLARIGHDLRQQLFRKANIETPSESHIVPVIIGDAGEALNMARYLRANGFDSLAIRKPTVAVGSERLRLSLNALLTDSDISRLVEVIGNYH